MKISALGIDIGKQVFHLAGADEHGTIICRKRLSRARLFAFLHTLPPCRVGMEACAGAHHLARQAIRYGHEVRLMSPHFVKPYVKSNKSDSLDAEAICEAMQRPTMRFVPVKSLECQDLQALHRVRSRAVANRTAQANQIRGLLLEYGITLPTGIGRLRTQLPDILEDADNGLTPLGRELISELKDELEHLDERVRGYDRRIARLAEHSEPCRRLRAVPGISPLVTTALVSALGDGQAFHNGRAVSAWLGLVPRQHSTGGRQKLLGISKRGDPYLRTLLIHGARAALQCSSRRDDPDSRRLNALAERRGKNVAIVAQANKLARVAWVILRRGETYRTMAS
jgi:transposase